MSFTSINTVFTQVRLNENLFWIILFVLVYATQVNGQNNYQIETLGYKFGAISGIVTNEQGVWVATNEGLYSPILNKTVLNDTSVRFIIKGSENQIWAITSGDMVRRITFDGTVIQPPFFYLNSYKQNQNTPSITSLSAYNDQIYIGTDDKLIIRFTSGSFGEPNPLFGTEITTNVQTIMSVYAQKPERDKNYSIVLCGADGLYVGQSKKENWKLKKVSAKDINLPDAPVKVLPSKKSTITQSAYFWLIGWNGSSSIAGKLVVDLATNETLFLQSDCLGQTSEQPYDFDLTSSEDLWIATANGLVFYTLQATCSKLSKYEPDTCRTQGIRRINKDTYTAFPLHTVHHVSVQNDSTIWFAANRGYVYRLTIKGNQTAGADEEKEQNFVAPPLTVGVFDKAKETFNFERYSSKDTKKHITFPNYTGDKNITSKEKAQQYIREIKKKVADQKAHEVHIIAYASEPADTTVLKTAREIAEDRAKQMQKLLKSVGKKRIKTHIVGYLPKEEGGPSNPDIVRVIVACTCEEFKMPGEVE
ncbi:MAG TPA: hypothetical protein PK239_14110 [Chitinophagales bacterium]|nr:hypothetical protein [Chitinophagales bacterium]HRK28405.1 hypothetical protein [Chitinophagales bacterium]